MKNLTNIILAAFLIIFPNFAVAQNQKIIANVNVISMKNSRVDRNRDVIIENGRIRAIVKTGGFKPANNSQIIDGTGKFLIPGLADMHVHAWDANLFFPLFLANGITSVRDMGGVLEPYRDWRKKTFAEVNFFAPKAFVGGMILNGAPSNAPFFADVRTPEKGRVLVRHLKTKSADFIKVYSFLTPQVYAAIADEAKKQNLPFAGHVPFAVSVTEASESGQRSIEHLRGLATAAAKDEIALRAKLAEIAEPVRTAEKLDFPTARKAYNFEEDAPIDSFDPEKLKKIAVVLRRNNTFVSPTLVVLQRAAQRGAADFRNDARLTYFPNFVKTIIIPRSAPTAEETAQDEKRFAQNLKMVEILHREKVKIIAGSDAPNPYSYPGFSVHEELEFYTRAGMSSFEALQTATVNAAEFMGKLNELGTIEPGKTADLVLLEANPLDSIANTRRIAAVFLDGRFLAREKLAAMLEKVDRDFNY